MAQIASVRPVAGTSPSRMGQDSPQGKIVAPGANGCVCPLCHGSGVEPPDPREDPTDPCVTNNPCPRCRA